jgi:hypothetical protein
VEAAAHLVVDAPGGHVFQRQRRHAQRRGIAAAPVVAEQKADRQVAGELGAPRILP